MADKEYVLRAEAMYSGGERKFRGDIVTLSETRGEQLKASGSVVDKGSTEAEAEATSQQTVASGQEASEPESEQAELTDTTASQRRGSAKRT